MVVYSRLLRLTDRGSLYTTAFSSSSLISIITLTSGFESARRPCNARCCPSSSGSHLKDIASMSRTVSGPWQLRTKHDERISRKRDLRSFALGSERGCTGRTKQSDPRDGPVLNGAR